MKEEIVHEHEDRAIRTRRLSRLENGREMIPSHHHALAAKKVLKKLT
jgi:hypothetical protein